jgi:hypothetical protein
VTCDSETFEFSQLGQSFIIKQDSNGEFKALEEHVVEKGTTVTAASIYLEELLNVTV